MPIAAVVVTLSSNAEASSAALRRLSNEPRVELGASTARVIPAVLETRTAEEGEALVNEILAEDGVLAVDVVSVDFSCDEVR